MKAHRFVTLDVFTDRRFGGNPLAVFPNAAGLSDAQMQSLAAEMNYSETTFVLPPQNPANTARVRIFTRQTELAFAGHPNVGTGYVLADWARGGLLRFEELAGLVEVRVERDAAGRLAGTTITAPQPLSLGAEVPAASVAACAGLAEADVLVTAHAPLRASVGNSYIIAEVSGEALTRSGPDIAAFRALAAAHPAPDGRTSLYLYARDGQAIRARMFSPLGGTFEDPATGSAATPLAALLLSLGDAEEAGFDITQGVEMGRPSLLRTRAWRTKEGIRASVGGGCVPVLEGVARV